MKTHLEIDHSTFELRRYPIQKNEKLQAWDSSDEYLIEELEKKEFPPKTHFLIMNDSFGALCCWAIKKGHQVSAVNDSFLSQQSMMKNLEANQLSGVHFLSSLDPLPTQIDFAVLKLTNNNRLLVWQLCQLSQHLNKDIKVISASKAKDIHTSTLKLFEKYLGPTHTSFAKKKARLIFCEKTIQLERLPAPTTVFDVPEYRLQLQNYPNVFSAESLDIAAYLMLSHIPSNDNIKKIIDLGCGNGVLSIQAARLHPHATITSVDESHMAIASAKINMKNHTKETTQSNCILNNCLDGFDENTADLILCNPPFHQLQAVSEHIAWQMFCDAKRVLEPQGRIVVIGNRHLGYHAKLKRLFNNTKTLASNNKFVIIEATKDPIMDESVIQGLLSK